MRKSSTETGIVAESFDPAFWSVAAVLGGAILYLACLISPAASRARGDGPVQREIVECALTYFTVFALAQPTRPGFAIAFSGLAAASL